MKKLFGYGLICLPFVLIIIGMIYAFGVIPALIIWGGALLLCSCIFYGVKFVVGG